MKPALKQKRLLPNFSELNTKITYKLTPLEVEQIS